MQLRDGISKAERFSGEELRHVRILGARTVGSVGLTHILAEEASVSFGREAQAGGGGGEGEGEAPPSLVVVCAEGSEGLAEGVKRSKGINPHARVLVFGPAEDLPLAHAALLAGTQGYVHAMMGAEQVLRAVEVAATGEIVAPRKMLEYLLLSGRRSVDLGALSGRQREILTLLTDGLSNAEIAQKLFLSESTIKQHLRAAYKVLGVNNRIEAARLIRDEG